MKTEIQAQTQLPPGPVEKFDLDTTPDSFAVIGQWLAQYGDIVRLHPEKRHQDSYLVNQPEYLKHILSRNYQNYAKGPAFTRVKMLLGNGIIVSEGDFWRRQRRMIQPAFNKKMIREYCDTMIKCNLALQEWQKGSGPMTVNITEAASTLALDIMLTTLFSSDLARMCEQQGGNPFLFLTQDTTRDLQVVLKFRALRQLMLQTIQARRKEQRVENDFLSMFMQARDKNTDEPMTDDELLDELMTMIIAGHETSAITLNWVWYFLARHQDAQQKVYDEVMQHVPENVPHYDQLESLVYTRQVIEEALRIYPPVWLYTRKAINDDHVGPYFVPAGTDIFISPYYLHRNLKIWQDPNQFNPDRFSAEQSKARHAFAYLPFSGGPRRCIGDFFGIVEIQVHLSIMIKRFMAQPADHQPIELDPGVNLRTKHPIYIHFNNR